MFGTVSRSQRCVWDLKSFVNRITTSFRISNRYVGCLTRDNSKVERTFFQLSEISKRKSLFLNWAVGKNSLPLKMSILVLSKKDHLWKFRAFAVARVSIEANNRYESSHTTLAHLKKIWASLISCKKQISKHNHVPKGKSHFSVWLKRW